METTAKERFVPEEEGTDASAGMQRETVRAMLDFVERNYVRLRRVSVRELIPEDEDQP